MHGVFPDKAAVAVNFVRPEDDAFAAVRQEIPGVAIARLGGVVRPGRFQRFAPAGGEGFVQSVETQMSACGGISFMASLRATSKRQGSMVFSATMAPRRSSSSGVPSVEPVSSAHTQSASRMDSIQRRANFASFLQIAYTQTLYFPKPITSIQSSPPEKLRRLNLYRLPKPFDAVREKRLRDAHRGEATGEAFARRSRDGGERNRRAAAVDERYAAARTERHNGRPVTRTGSPRWRLAPEAA